MHDFTDQIERLLIVVVLILFGGAIVRGLLAPLTWTGVALGLFLLLILRPMGGTITLGRSRVSWPERLVIAFFGIRGIGSFFYLAYAINDNCFADARAMWAITGFTVLLSIVLHGVLRPSWTGWAAIMGTLRPWNWKNRKGSRRPGRKRLKTATRVRLCSRPTESARNSVWCGEAA